MSEGDVSILIVAAMMSFATLVTVVVMRYSMVRDVKRMMNQNKQRLLDRLKLSRSHRDP